jgi:hypothetical protein
MLQAAGYDNAVAVMQLAYDVEYRIASFDNSEEATTCGTRPQRFKTYLIPTFRYDFVRYTGYDGTVDPSDTETGFQCIRKYAKLNELQDTISKDLDWRAYVEVQMRAL